MLTYIDKGGREENGKVASPESISSDLKIIAAPCATNPCMNYGSCSWYDETPGDFHCSCQPPYDGEMCEYKVNPCVWPAEPGICDQMIPRWYYDKFAQECLPFNYTGKCGESLASLYECT